MAVEVVGAEGAVVGVAPGQGAGVQFLHGVRPIVGEELAAFLGIAKKGDAGAVDFDREHTPAGHKIVEQQAGGATGEANHGQVDVPVVGVEAARVAGYALDLAAAEIAQGIDGVDAVAGEHVHGAFVVGRAADPVFVEAGVGGVDGTALVAQGLAAADHGREAALEGDAGQDVVAFGQ